MNYQNIYTVLCARGAARMPNSVSKSEAKIAIPFYVERHRIIPGCMGGKYEIGNVAWLTAEEHFLAHKLLVKIYPDNHKILWAAWRIQNKSSGMTNKQYGWLRSKFIMMVSRPKSEEHKRKIGEANKGNMKFLGKTHSQETKDKISNSKIGKKREFSEEWKENLSKAGKGRRQSEETKRKISESKKGQKHTEATKQKIAEKNMGKKASQETKDKMSVAHVGNKNRLGIPHTTETKLKISESNKGRIPWNKGLKRELS